MQYCSRCWGGLDAEMWLRLGWRFRRIIYARYLLKSAEWHARRAKNIGSSEVAALFGCQAPYAMSLYALWYVKAGIVPPPNVDNPRTRAGTMMEDAIAHVVAHENGWTIQRDTFCVDP